MSWQTELAAARRDAASLAKHMATLNALVGDSVAQVAEIGKGMGIDVNLSAVEASLRIPYVLWRVSPEEWKVLVWRGRADMPLIGIPDFQTDGFVISTLNRGARLFTDVPEEIEKIVGWEKPAFETRFNAARTEIRVTRGEPDRFKAKYGRYLGEIGAEGFKVKKGQAWLDLLAHLLDDDIVPHSVVPVDPHDWDANAPCQIEFAGKRAYQMGYVEQFLRDGSETVLLPSGAGKAQPLDAKILTPLGWKRMGDMRVGDRVIDPTGGTTRVLGVFPQGIKKIYRVTFSDGSTTECCEDHLWVTQNYWQRNDWTRGRIRTQSAWSVCDLKTIMQNIRDRSGHLNYTVPLTRPVEFSRCDSLPLDPYLLGVLIGDGHLGNHMTNVTTADEEIVNGIRATLPLQLKLVHYPSAPPCDYAIVQKRRSSKDQPIRAALQNMGLLGTLSTSKFIPDVFKYASIDNRIALLQGLLDTDGHVDPRPRHTCNIEYATSSLRLANDVQFLVQTLGGIAKVSSRIPQFVHKGKKRTGARSYRIRIKLPGGIAPFRLSRKMRAYAPATRYVPRRFIASVEYVGDKPAQCISIDSKSGLYLTDDLIVTHNTFIALFLISHIVGPQYIFCDSDVLVGQWKNRIADKAPHRIKDVRVVTYQWAATHVNEIAGVLGIFDEAHRQVAPTWTRLVFARLKYHVSMTATPGDKKRRAMLVALGGNVRLTPFAQLIDAGALNRPETYCYQVRDASYKLAWTKKLLHDNPRQRTWIFCDTLALGHELSRQLGLPFIYGDTPHKYERVAEERQCILSKAMEASLDFSDLELVVDYDVSKTGRSPVSAGQRIGRGMHAAACKYYILMTPDELARYGDRLVGIEMQIGDVIKYVDLTGEGRIKLSAPRKTRAKPTPKVVVKEGDKVGAILAAPAIRRLILDHEKNLGATRQGYMAKAFRVLWKSSGTSEELRLRAGKAKKTWEWYQAGLNELVKAGLAKKVKKRYSLDRARVTALTR